MTRRRCLNSRLGRVETVNLSSKRDGHGPPRLEPVWRAVTLMLQGNVLQCESILAAKARDLDKSNKIISPYGLASISMHLHSLNVCADKTFTRIRNCPWKCGRPYVGLRLRHELQTMVLSFVQITPMSEGCKQKVMILYY